MSFLNLPNLLIAYPQYYDYIHSIEFRDEGKIEMVDGAGQVLITLGRGKFRLYVSDNDTAELEIMEFAEFYPYAKEYKALSDFDPYGEREKIRDLDNLRVRVRKELGLFPFACETIWNVPNMDDWPCKLFKERYIFDFDPLGYNAEKAATNLYHTLSKKDFTNESNIYYSRTDGQSLSRKDLIELGVPLELFW